MTQSQLAGTETSQTTLTQHLWLWISSHIPYSAWLWLWLCLVAGGVLAKRTEVWAGKGRGVEQRWNQQQLLKQRKQKQQALQRRRVWLRARMQKNWFLKKAWAFRYHDPILEKCGKLCQGRLYTMRHSDINHLLRFLRQSFSYMERLRLLSAMFLGGLYRLGPLGEGPRGRYDRDPLFRLDRVDCVTYVETVMAFAMSRSVKEAVATLQKIRYKEGKIRYSYRNHFTASQWLVNNAQAGYVQQITAQVGGSLTRHIDRKIFRETWKGTLWEKRIPFPLLPKSYRLAYIPLRDVPKILDRLPAMAWMGEVKDREGDPVSVQHVGFVVRKGKHTVFRDANIMPGVSDRSLISYAKWRMRQAHEPNRRYVIVGFAFASFVDVDKNL